MGQTFGLVGATLPTTRGYHSVEGDWVICATGHSPEKVLTGPPSRVAGIFPFVALERRGERRLFSYTKSARSAENVTDEWQPSLRPVPLAQPAAPKSTELQSWLVDLHDPNAEPPQVEGMTAARREALAGWLDPHGGGGHLFEAACAGFGVPTIAARLVEAGPDDPDPEGGTVVEPMGAASVIGSAFSASDKEPAGRSPVAALGRVLWRTPALGIALGAGEILVAVVPIVLLVGGDLSWWFWVIAVVFLLGGLVHVGQGLLRLNTRRQHPPD